MLIVEVGIFYIFLEILRLSTWFFFILGQLFNFGNTRKVRFGIVPSCSRLSWEEVNLMLELWSECGAKIAQLPDLIYLTLSQMGDASNLRSMNSRRIWKTTYYDGRKNSGGKWVPNTYLSHFAHSIFSQLPTRGIMGEKDVFCEFSLWCKQPLLHETAKG